MLEVDDWFAAPEEAAVTQRRRRRRQRRVRPGRVLRLAATFSLLISVVSFITSMLGPSSTPFSIRSVEWLKSNGASGIVNEIETVYYSMTAPSTGGPALRKLPGQAGRAVTRLPTVRPGATLVRHYEPPAIRPLIHPALAGEGQWRAPFKKLGVRYPPVLITSFRSDPSYPQMVAGVAWIDTTETSTWLYPGRQEPSVSLPSRGPMEVPTNMRSRLVATFNSGFKLADSGGGVVLNGRTYAPLKRGDATFIRYRSGRLNVIAWPGGPTAGRNVTYARQNLPLIVDNGRANPNLSDGPEWGATLGNAIRVWRSAVGVDRHGNLLYAVANYQTVGSLAQIMIHAGAVRAMELDINAEWPSFITYTGPGARGAANLLPGMMQSPQRYLTPDDRDFFAVYLR